MEDILESVRHRYTKAIALTGESNRKWRDGSGIFGMAKGSYDGEILDGVPKALQRQSFGCGNPVRYADLRRGNGSRLGVRRRARSVSRFRAVGSIRKSHRPRHDGRNAFKRRRKTFTF